MINKTYKVKVTKQVTHEIIIDVDSVTDCRQAVHVAEYLATKNNYCITASKVVDDRIDRVELIEIINS